MSLKKMTRIDKISQLLIAKTGVSIANWRWSWGYLKLQSAGI